MSTPDPLPIVSLLADIAACRICRDTPYKLTTTTARLISALAGVLPGVLPAAAALVA